MHQEMKSTKKKQKPCALKVNKYSERNIYLIPAWICKIAHKEMNNF